MAAELLAHIPVETGKVEIEVALEDPVMLQHPVIFLADIWLEHGRGELGMIGDAENVADVMQQRTDDIFLVPAVAIGERRSLEAPLKTIDGEAAILAREQTQMRKDAVGQPP